MKATENIEESLKMESNITNDVSVGHANTIAEHRLWLQQFNKQQLKKWEDLLKANPEAAICEAETRKLLSDHNIDVKPSEDLSQGGPDFLCTMNGKTFYVEVTCITIKAATKVSGLTPSVRSFQVQDYLYMTERIRSEISNKTSQCSNTKTPCVVVIATLHSQAGELCFDDLAAEELLTATTYITRKINTITGEPVGDAYEGTQLENSVFIRPNKNTPNRIEHARNSVSAVLLCGFGSIPPNVVGCLHPNPNYPFDRDMLPKIKFCKLTPGCEKTSRLTVEWI